MGGFTPPTGYEVFKTFTASTFSQAKTNSSSSNYRGYSSGNTTQANALATILTFYNPNPLKGTLNVYTGVIADGSVGITKMSMQVSNDGINWVNIATDISKTQYISDGITNSIGYTNNYRFQISTDNNSYKYFKCIPTKVAYTGGGTYPSNWVFIDLSQMQVLTSQLNSIIFPMTYTTTNYGVGFSYIGGASTTAYISTKSNSGLTLEDVDTSSNGACWLSVGY